MSEPAASAIEVFYDGGCPVCLREVRVLRWLDRRARRQTGLSGPEQTARQSNSTVLPVRTDSSAASTMRRLFTASRM